MDVVVMSQRNEVEEKMAGFEMSHNNVNGQVVQVFCTFFSIAKNTLLYNPSPTTKLSPPPPNYYSEPAACFVKVLGP